MKIIVGNIASKAVIGGRDNLIGNVYKELREYLRVRPTGYHEIMKDMKQKGNKYGWDGYTYFFNKSGQFPTGLLPLVISHATSLGCTIEVQDMRTNIVYFKDAEWDWDTPEFRLYKHQRKLVKSTSNIIEPEEHDVYFPRGVWKAATNSGKTAAFGGLINNVENARAILLVDDQFLLRQHFEFYKQMFPGKGEVGVITSKSYKQGSLLTIAMVKTLYNRLRKYPTVQRDLTRYNILGVDECHDFCGKTSTYVINHIDAYMRVAMSGTPFGMEDKVARLRLVGMFGSVLHSVSKRYLMDNGFSMIPQVTVYLNPAKIIAIDYDSEYANVVLESEERAELIADIICKRRKKKILINFFEEKHGYLMYKTFCERYPTLMHLANWVHGEDPLREKKVQGFIDNRIRILFASTIMQQGYNIKDIEVIIHAMAGKGTTALSQFMGRGERLDGINTHFEWIEIFDQGKYMSKHSRRRLAFYKREDLPTPIKFMYANRRGNPKST